MNKVQKLQETQEAWTDCTRCGLCQPEGRVRRQVVFGEGNPNAQVLIVGDAPSKEDEMAGQPFKGRVGELVDSLLHYIGSSRRDVYLTNVVGCRATEINNPKQDRKPANDEIKACSARLQRIIEVVDPFVVLLLGDVAFKTLSSSPISMTKALNDVHRQQVEVTTMGVLLPIPRTGFVSHHPQRLLDNWNDKPGGPVESSFKIWKKAFEVADTYALIYRGTIPPDRGER